MWRMTTGHALLKCENVNKRLMPLSMEGPAVQGFNCDKRRQPGGSTVLGGHKEMP